MDSDIPSEFIRIKEEPNVDYYASEDWSNSAPCNTLLKVEILDPEENQNNKEALTCKLCNVLFINHNELNIHRMIHSDNHNCFVCKEFIKNRFQFMGHVRRHMCLKPFQCSDCSRTFQTSRETKLHQRVHSDDRPYMCTECGKAFKQLTTLKDHEVVHTGEKRFKCKICEGAFATATSLRRHIRVMHEAIRSFKCHCCSEEFISKQALTQHMLVHKDLLLKCQMCDEHFENFEELTNHKETHHELKQSGICEYCGNKTFYYGLKDHIKKMHQPRQCGQCELVFYDQKSMDNHLKSHLEEAVKSELICNLCGKNFEFPRYLKAHMKRHEEDYKKFKCDLCLKTFSSKRDLTDHLNVHANVKNYCCEICGKAFRTKQSVSKHMPIHSDKRPFQCKLCDKRFKKQSILRKHSFTHQRTRPFKCDLCDKAYKSGESLRVHKFSHQRSNYQCNICNKKFKFLSVYKGHPCFKEDGNSFWIKCKFCKNICKSYVTYIQHMVFHSKQTPFECNICGEKFLYLYKLRLHEFSHVNSGSGVISKV